jgi:hypothetical protein
MRNKTICYKTEIDILLNRHENISYFDSMKITIQTKDY